jgi:hypothetical protein
MECAYCAVGTESLKVIELKGPCHISSGQLPASYRGALDSIPGQSL